MKYELGIVIVNGCNLGAARRYADGTIETGPEVTKEAEAKKKEAGR